MITSLNLILPAICLILSAILPSPWADRHARRIRSWVVAWVTLSFAIALFSAVSYQVSAPGANGHSLSFWPGISPGTSTALLDGYYDSVSSIMLVLVTFIGWVTCRFSIRYLDGEPHQGRYFKWLAFTISAVSLMVISGNLLTFVASWILTSCGLHPLLTHYADRPLAQRAAWTKFIISRLGDLVLVVAMVLIFQTYESLTLAGIFDRAAQYSAESSKESVQFQSGLIAWLLILGAAIKSAQFPFHAWLPETLETPTPVSALMHAGIVNAGGYFLIRLSPLLVVEAQALQLLAVAGTLTACIGVLSMLSQSSIKRALAYSTVAQMGFMMLQCGLGAFSAALLHLVAHSLYKAYAFLNSGSIDFRARHEERFAPAAIDNGEAVKRLASALACATIIVGGTSFVLKPEIFQEPRLLVLAWIMTLALSSWLGNLFVQFQWRAVFTGLATASLISLVYLISFRTFHRLTLSDLPALEAFADSSLTCLIIGLMISFLFGFHVCLQLGLQRHWLNHLRVHASNGFYVNTFYRRISTNLMHS